MVNFNTNRWLFTLYVNRLADPIQTQKDNLVKSFEWKKIMKDTSKLQGYIRN